PSINPAPPVGFQLNFNGSTTGLLPPNASALAVQNALNALPTIAAAGGVTVTIDPSSRPQIQGVQGTGSGGQFQLTYTNLAGVSATTTAIGFNAIPSTVAALLNTLPNVNTLAGDLFVVTQPTPLGTQGYTITFSSSQPFPSGLAFYDQR